MRNAPGYIKAAVRTDGLPVVLRTVTGNEDLRVLQLGIITDLIRHLPSVLVGSARIQMAQL